MILNAEQINQLEQITEKTLNELYEKDKILIKRGGLERSIAFRFGLYFFCLTRKIEWLSNLDIDLEYNKSKGNNIKPTSSKPNGSAPDFILHKREEDDLNILVIEFKGYWNNYPRESDKNKIEDFTDQDGIYKYGLGMLVELNKTSSAYESVLDYEPEI